MTSVDPVRPEVGSDAGFTLIEVLVALTILTVAVITLVGAMASLTMVTTHQRGLSGTDTVVRDLGEAVKKQAIHRTTTAKCAQWSDLNPNFTFPTGYAMVGTPTIEYWVPSLADPLSGSFTAANDRLPCTTYYETLCGTDTRPECDPGVQRVTLKVESTAANTRGGQTTTQVLVRKSNR